MGSGPTGNRFEVWGEALYAVKATTNQPYGQPSNGFVLLFAISDINRKWLGWYSFTTDFVVDILMVGSTHELIGEGTSHPWHFMTRKPIAVDGLLGGPGDVRQAALEPHNWDFGGDAIGLNVVISQAPGPQTQISVLAGLPTTRPLHLLIRRIKAGGPAGPTFGWVSLIASEPFWSKSHHLNVVRHRHRRERQAINP